MMTGKLMGYVIGATDMSCVDLKGKNNIGCRYCWFNGSNLVKYLYNDVEDVTVIGIDSMNC